jgi:DNA-binding XRE family transcriptional regulator
MNAETSGGVFDVLEDGLGELQVFADLPLTNRAGAAIVLRPVPARELLGEEVADMDGRRLWDLPAFRHDGGEIDRKRFRSATRTLRKVPAKGITSSMVGDKLRKWRKQNGNLSTRQAADRAGVSQPVWIALEKGEGKRTGLGVAMKICALPGIGVTLEELAAEEGKRSPKRRRRPSLAA